MSAAEGNLLHVIAMHGWAGDASCWTPWIEATQASAWRWQCGERGYGELARFAPAWPRDSLKETLRVVIAHSLGPHLVVPEVLQQADAVILLASFAAFVPPDRARRRVRAALDGMAAKLGSEWEAKDMLRKFFTNVAAPQSADLLPAGPADGALHLGRLREDFDILRECEGLPCGFPANARVLIVEAGEDRIVDPAARTALRETLPNADAILLPGVGHALLHPDLIPRVVQWVGQL